MRFAIPGNRIHSILTHNQPILYQTHNYNQFINNLNSNLNSNHISNRCTAITLKGSRCLRKGPHVIRYNGYCWQHTPTRFINDDNRCTETTQRGTRCKRRGPDVVSHSGYCWQHR